MRKVGSKFRGIVTGAPVIGATFRPLALLPRIEFCMTQDAPGQFEGGCEAGLRRRDCEEEESERGAAAPVAGMLHPPRASHLTGDKRQEEVQDCGQRHKTNGVPGGRASPTRLFILRRT